MLEIHGDNAPALKARAGELIVLTGRCGSGKSLWLQRLAGLEPMPQNIRCLLNGRPWPEKTHDKITVRMHFDRWPPLWLGQTVSEELQFGLGFKPNIERIRSILRQWRLHDVEPEARLSRINRMQAIRLDLAGMELAGTRLCLVDNPAAALPLDDALELHADMADMARRIGCIIVVASCRWQDWTRVASQIWMLDQSHTLPRRESPSE